ncbi:MAG TPA: hypothetical protein PKB01_05985, partial [Xanthobacteraceae bacterium]|nr:hypothetical protein [Xanthobacteraceae bacterium]
MPRSDAATVAKTEGCVAPATAEPNSCAFLPVEYQRARRARRTVGRERHAMQQLHRQTGPVLLAQVDVEHFNARRARRRHDVLQQRRASALHQRSKRHPFAADFRDVVAEPVRERRVQVTDASLLVGGEESGGRVVEEVDCLLQRLERRFLPLAIARDVGHGPRRDAREAALGAERTSTQAKPARRAIRRFGRHADFFHMRTAGAHRL